jgi:AraC-like DNA-binding protein
MRLNTPISGAPRKIATEIGAARVFSGMLRSLADTLSEITTDHARPIELAFPEFLVTSLLDNAPAKALGGAAGMRAVLLERIFQTIEIRLSDPGLSYQQVAAEHGISPRYLQKLFESINDSFGHYVKVRRLERCRLDLRSPLHAQKSISDILFEWGFNDSASFSRAFREQYGVSPREYRKAQPREDESVARTLNRGHPGKSGRGAARAGRRAGGAGGAVARNRQRSRGRGSGVIGALAGPFAIAGSSGRGRWEGGTTPSPPGQSGDGALGLSQSLAQAGTSRAVRRLRHDRDADPSCQ